jgi:hypothetical protein
LATLDDAGASEYVVDDTERGEDSAGFFEEMPIVRLPSDVVMEGADSTGKAYAWEELASPV